MACNEAPLTDCLFKATQSLDRRFICRSKEPAWVIHNHHWMRKINFEYRIDSQQGALHVSEMLDGYRPHTLRNNASSLQTPAAGMLLVNAEGFCNAQLPPLGQHIDKEHSGHLSLSHGAENRGRRGSCRHAQADYGRVSPRLWHR